MKILNLRSKWAMVAFVLLLLTVAGCYNNQEYTLKNPRHLPRLDWDNDEMPIERLLDSTSGVFSLPPGHEEQMLPARLTPNWRLGDSHPDKIKTIYYDSTKQINPSGYSWENGSLIIMESRNYQYVTYQVDLDRVDSIRVMFSDTEEKEGITRLISALSFIAFVIVMSATID